MRRRGGQQEVYRVATFDHLAVRIELQMMPARHSNYVDYDS
jgi:hypothetical protein